VAWFGIRFIFEADKEVYEERITVWEADSFVQALARGEADALEYADQISGKYLGLAQAFMMPDGCADGNEVFSLIRQSRLKPEAYVDHFFDTGGELQRAEPDLGP
jgi:hypothetical protein